jgi:hypothetical protein
LLLNVLDFPDQSGTGGPDRVKAALDAAVDGDRIYLAGAWPYRAPTRGWTISKSIELFGDGPGNPDTPGAQRTGTTLLPQSAAATDHVIRLVSPQGGELNRVYIHDLCISSSTSSREGGDGIHYGLPDNPGKLSGLRLERLCISRMAGNGISLIGQNGGAGSVTDLLVLNCAIDGCGGDGFRLQFGYAMAMLGCRVVNCIGRALAALPEGELAMYSCSFDGGSLSAPELVSINSVGVRLDACRFANFGATTNKVGLRLTNIGASVVVSGCTFELPSWGSDSAGAVGLDVSYASQLFSTGTVCIMPNRFMNLGTAIRGNNAGSDNIHALFVSPQFGTPLTVGGQPASVIALPAIADNAACGAPCVNDGTTSRSPGLLVPSLSANPTDQLQPSHLVYNSSADKLRIWTSNGWRDVILA